jgi:hydroxycarboxylate dehydrogenase B
MTDPESRDGTVLVEWSSLLDFVTEILSAVGLETTDARDMATQIINSELAGHESHGVRRLPEYVERARGGFVNTGSTGRVELDLGALVRIDGDEAFGHLVMRDATRIAVERAQMHGIAAVAVRNAEWAGRFADFCEEAASRGVATLMFVNDSGSGQSASAPGALEPRLSTNPIAAGIPRGQSPHLVLDMATTAVAMGRVSEWRDRGEPIPPEWANEAGVLQFFGGAKGFGLALIAEALAGDLTGAGTVSSAAAPDRQGVFLIAIDVAKLKPIAEFTAEVERFARYVKDVPLAEGSPPIRLPGEMTAVTSERRRAAGTPVQLFSWQSLVRLAELYGVDPPARVP